MTPRAVFVDTGAWVALRYGRDAHHAKARERVRRLRRDGLGLVTSEWVLAETVTLLKARGAVDHALALGESIQDGTLGQLVEATPVRRQRAWALFRRYRDLRVGYVDCTSFTVMEELGLDTAFGFDDDFTKAGFRLYR